MADLSTLQEVGILAGIAGFFLGLLNAVQAWRQNRPTLTVQCTHPPDADLEIAIFNPGKQAITVRNGKFLLPGAPSLKPHYQTTAEVVRSVLHKDINWIIPSNVTAKFVLTPDEDRSILLCISWHTNAAFLLSRLPLFLYLSVGRQKLLRRAGVAEE